MRKLLPFLLAVTLTWDIQKSTGVPRGGQTAYDGATNFVSSSTAGKLDVYRYSMSAATARAAQTIIDAAKAGIGICNLSVK